MYLKDNPIVQQDRIQLIREEARERQKEIREAAERAKELKKAQSHHSKKAKGRHVEFVPGSDDAVAPATLAGRAADIFSINGTESAPLNTRANNKLGDSTTTYTAGEAEQEIAFIGLNGLCAWNDGRGFYKSPQDVQGYGYTTDGGATWTDGGVPLKQGTISTWSSDPVVSVNEKTGEFYYSGLTTNTSSANGVGVARGHFSGSSFVWDGAAVVASGSSTSYAYDKEWMCADSSSNYVYATWTLFTTTTDYVQFSRSADGGATWSAAVQVSKSWENGLVSGSRPCVGPNGEVYIVYSAIGPTDADSMKILKSTDHGATWSPSYAANFVYDNYFCGAPGFNRGRAITFPSVAVDRSLGNHRGRVYITYHDCVNFYGDALGSSGAKSEVENNGNYANATPFTINNTLRGTISPSTDSDYWKFSATQGTTYIFFVDSLRTSTFKYTMRIYCPNDTVNVSRLCMSSDGSSSSSVNVHALIVWTCPATNTYYLRMTPSTSTGGYRIRTGQHGPLYGDVARDHRDIVFTYSDNGMTGWTTRARVNDDPGYMDDWLPEVAVPVDGNPYIMWYDWRNTSASCYGGSDIYMTRSLDGGSTWASNVVATTYTTQNWTQTYSNIAPNQGDYNAMYGGDCLALAWADCRPPFSKTNTLGDPDVWTARILPTFSVACGADQQAYPSDVVNVSEGLNNANVVFPLNVNYTLSCDRAWPGFPMTGSASASEGGSATLPFGFTVPDTAAEGFVHLCLNAVLPNGAISRSCCQTLEVLPTIVGTMASLVSASAAGGRVEVVWQLGAGSSAALYRSVDGASWERIATLSADGLHRVSYVDQDVSGGHRYGYRLGLMSGGAEVTAGEAWVDVPVHAVFALHGARPNPSAGSPSLWFSLADGSPATLAVLDLSGRRVFEEQVGSLGAGVHMLALERAHLPAGIYAIRLTQSGRTLTGKFAVVR